MEKWPENCLKSNGSDKFSKNMALSKSVSRIHSSQPLMNGQNGSRTYGKPCWRFRIRGSMLETQKKWTARDLGRFLGRQCAVERLIWDEVPLSPRVKEEKARWIDWQMEKIHSNHAPAIALTRDVMGLEKWRRIFKKFIDEILASARERPYAESSAFFDAFGRANVIEADELATERTMGVGERIAYVMVLMWRDIARLESVAQLHQLLSAAAKPMGIVITLKRVEKLCQRIGLKFKGRGRPKRKIQTNPPAAS